jgi:hypothetical protein
MKITKKLNSATLAFLALGFLAQVNAVEPLGVQPQDVQPLGVQPQDMQPQDMQPQKNPEKPNVTRFKEHMVELAKKELDKGFLTPEVANSNRQKLDQFLQDPDSKAADLSQILIGLTQQVAIIEKLEEGMNRKIRRTVPREIIHNVQIKNPKLIDVVKTLNYIDVKVDFGKGDVKSVGFGKNSLEKEALWTVFTITKEMKNKSIDEFPQFLEQIKSNDEKKNLIGEYSLKKLDQMLNDCRMACSQELSLFHKKNTKNAKSAPNDGYEPLRPAPSDAYGEYLLAQHK